MRLQVLADDISGGRERVRVPLVCAKEEAPPPPDFTYRRDYTASPAASLVISEMHRRGLVQWAGTANTRGSLPRFTADESVRFTKEGVLEKILFTPCVEDARGLKGSLPACALVVCVADWMAWGWHAVNVHRAGLSSVQTTLQRKSMSLYCVRLTCMCVHQLELHAAKVCLSCHVAI